MGVRRSASSSAICAAHRRDVSASARDRPALTRRQHSRHLLSSLLHCSRQCHAPPERQRSLWERAPQTCQHACAWPSHPERCMRRPRQGPSYGSDVHVHALRHWESVQSCGGAAPEVADDERGDLVAAHVRAARPQQHAPRGHQVGHLLEGHLRKRAPSAADLQRSLPQTLPRFDRTKRSALSTPAARHAMAPAAHCLLAEAQNGRFCVLFCTRQAR